LGRVASDRKTGNVSNSTLKKIIANVTVDIMAVLLMTENA